MSLTPQENVVVPPLPPRYRFRDLVLGDTMMDESLKAKRSTSPETVRKLPYESRFMRNRIYGLFTQTVCDAEAK
ncbi:hypothetical protein ElyMa_006611700 [Elysia marginata]|uniref:Uncharacterized protein n=1 Tax=Elysia marginata TaxID=1093978 RepID=A0AAV4IG63_9GAST|nr:hypothetical protein ElyMa_006611700 [Elysia marginata]